MVEFSSLLLSLNPIKSRKLKVSRSQNKIVELKLFPKNKQVNLFYGKSFGSTILFRDLLTFTKRYEKSFFLSVKVEAQTKI